MKLQEMINNKSIEVAKKHKELEILTNRQRLIEETNRHNASLAQVKRVLDSSDLSALNQINCAQEVYNEAVNKANKIGNETIDLIASIQGLAKNMPKELEPVFIANNKRYAHKLSGNYDLKNDTVEELRDFHNDLRKFLNQYSKS